MNEREDLLEELRVMQRQYSQARGAFVTLQALHEQVKAERDSARAALTRMHEELAKSKARATSAHEMHTLVRKYRHRALRAERLLDKAKATT